MIAISQNFNFDVFFSSCIVKPDFWQAQLIRIVLPVAVFVILIAVSFILYKFQQHQHPERFVNQSLPSPVDRAIALYLKMIMGMATYVVMVGFAPFRCYLQMDGTYTLVPSSDLNCYDEQWMSHINIIVLGLAQIFLLPLLVLLIFRIYRGHLDENRFKWRFGLLTLSYLDQFYWWEVVVLFRKLVFVMVVDLTNDFDSYLRVFLAEVVLILGIFVEYIYQPRKAELRMLHIL
jgi:hypothetical protein